MLMWKNVHSSKKPGEGAFADDGGGHEPFTESHEFNPNIPLQVSLTQRGLLLQFHRGHSLDTTLARATSQSQYSSPLGPLPRVPKMLGGC